MPTDELPLVLGKECAAFWQGLWAGAGHWRSYPPGRSTPSETFLRTTSSCQYGSWNKRILHQKHLLCTVIYRRKLHQKHLLCTVIYIRNRRKLHQKHLLCTVIYKRNRRKLHQKHLLCTVINSVNIFEYYFFPYNSFHLPYTLLEGSSIIELSVDTLKYFCIDIYV